MTILSGMTFYMPKNDPRRTAHLWIVLTDPDENGKFLGVNITSYELFKDLTVILTAGEHPFIVKRSVVQYTDARIFTVENMDLLIGRGFAELREECSDALLEKARAGLMKSDHAPQDAQDYLELRLS